MEASSSSAATAEDDAEGGAGSPPPPPTPPPADPPPDNRLLLQAPPIALSTFAPSVSVEERVQLNSVRDIFLRYLAPQDIDPVKALCREMFPIDYPDYWYWDITSRPQFYSLGACLSRSGELVGILVAQVKTLGQCSNEDRDLLAKKFEPNTRVAYILSLGVARKCRRQGVANRLLDHFLQYLCCGLNTSLGEAKAVYLHVLVTNQVAIRFYERRKFKVHARLSNYYSIEGRPYDGFTYVLYINGGEPAWSLAECLRQLTGVVCYPFRRLRRAIRSVLS